LLITGKLRIFAGAGAEAAGVLRFGLLAGSRAGLGQADAADASQDRNRRKGKASADG